ncbi:DUF333 domain-containing protein [Brenneria goodwinii]|uniref:DUF333 domain-containing protein n=1 Tax=Brenneria goodwinii TaxID=1109412 RepID=A0A0G4K056_9GAMM|nr:DUF333 domain-containing protein [Brenneria goodwinii]MCG8155816.1 DUF333 domain-containing protein [Brenneria goodwinii]MCG8160648.1 DUF333 domain-containing protein [Brenneria goodwinii]MCG8166914.1 DUF333 domain-containing protein [Brenneria goodwinii]MCG8172583.1 DUF333 domain-containing protein [Brenneria goodwinii]MCG8177353.1 DUF333 domain-containing protein [Brenneria goodwinii]
MKLYQWLFTAAVLVLSGCGNSERTTAVNQQEPSFNNGNPTVLLKSDSPADASCSLMGGTMALSRQLNGASVGTCQLANGKRCDERALMNGTCPAG